ncbi:GDSL-type esterase/lipase family protein [Desulfopila sp. IMCC35008]|uniref:SGNH/GDSL hydrolase family protein n=1 Tax=Desulfopila sp. IMCC35008 TaxID=2653858 RepID=UPI0013D1C2E9|nr:GDSL-type esterase/lipase family protein [Desulfopila sp. IMCC35008]
MYYQDKVKAYHELNKLLNNNEKHIVVAGDSFVEQFPVDELFDEFKILNRGIGKDSSKGLFDRTDNNINNINISSCFIMVGHNDIKYRKVSETVDLIVSVLNKIKSDRLYFISILPDCNVNDNELFIVINRMVKDFCRHHRCQFVDAYNLFVNENECNQQLYTSDEVHLNIYGYKLLAKKIDVILKK